MIIPAHFISHAHMFGGINDEHINGDIITAAGLMSRVDLDLELVAQFTTAFPPTH
jgi:hypothetical protein